MSQAGVRNSLRQTGGNRCHFQLYFLASVHQRSAQSLVQRVEKPTRCLSPRMARFRHSGQKQHGSGHPLRPKWLIQIRFIGACSIQGRPGREGKEPRAKAFQRVRTGWPPRRELPQQKCGKEKQPEVKKICPATFREENATGVNNAKRITPRLRNPSMRSEEETNQCTQS